MTAPTIKSWAKPHLRARLIQEHNNSLPKETSGSPGAITVVPTGGISQITSVKPGDRVRLTKPANVLEGPCWVEDMDKFDGAIVRVHSVHNSIVDRFYIYDAMCDTHYGVMLKWVSEKL